MNTMRSGSKQIIETALFFHNNMRYKNLQRRVRSRVFITAECLCVCHSELSSMTNICFLSDGWMMIAPLVLSAGGEWF